MKKLKACYKKHYDDRQEFSKFLLQLPTDLKENPEHCPLCWCECLTRAQKNKKYEPEPRTIEGFKTKE